MHDAPASSVTQTYGAGPSTPPQMFQAQPKPVSRTDAASSNTTTAKSKGTSYITSLDTPPDATAPALTANASTAPALVSGSVNTPAKVGDTELDNFHMPETMEQIDNQRPLTVNDQFVYQVLEDHEKKQVEFVNENGSIGQLPYLPDLNMKVEGSTLYAVAHALKEKLEDPKLGYYKRATVLLAFYKGNGSRGHVTVYGEVSKPGLVDVPADSVLTLFQAITSSGGFKDSADKEHIQIIHHDLDPGKANTQEVSKQEVNYQKFIESGQDANVLLQPGDFINVPSRSDRPQEDIMVVGEVPSMQVLAPPNGTPLYLSKVMIRVGFTPWSNHTVDLVRMVNGKRTDTYHDVDEVLEKGNTDKDVQLQAGDVIIVKRNWYSF